MDALDEANKPFGLDVIHQIMTTDLHVEKSANEAKIKGFGDSTKHKLSDDHHTVVGEHSDHPELHPKKEEQNRRLANRRVVKKVDLGCRMHGYIEIPSVSGSLRFAPKRQMSQDGIAMLMNMLGAHVPLSHQLNLSHTINHVSIGNPLRQSARREILQVLPVYSHKAQLDQQQRYKDKPASFSYFIKIIPEDIDFYQFSVTEHAREVDGNRQLPSVHLFFEVSPLRRETKLGTRAFLRFVVNCISVVGGVFAVGGFLERLLASSFSEKKGLVK